MKRRKNTGPSPAAKVKKAKKKVATAGVVAGIATMLTTAAGGVVGELSEVRVWAPMGVDGRWWIAGLSGLVGAIVLLATKGKAWAWSLPFFGLATGSAMSRLFSGPITRYGESDMGDTEEEGEEL